MARMYRHPEGGNFYDAFGGKIGEVEEVWAGDSFDRNATLSFCADGMNYDAAIKGIVSQPKVISAQDYGEVTFSCDLATDKDYSFSALNNIAITSSIDELKENLEYLQEQIDSLKQSKTVAKGIREELKTLHYKREIE